MSMTDPKQIAGLLDRVNAATGADGVLDSEIDFAMKGLRNLGGYWAENIKTGERVRVNYNSPDYTASIDAALALVERVLPGEWPLILDTATATMWATESRIEFSGSKIDLSRLPLAILAALLSALSSPTLNSEDK